MRHSQGFTLVEVLIAVSIFATVSVLAATTYGMTIRLERQSSSHRLVQQNASFLMEYLGKEVRNGSLNYASYASDGSNLMAQPRTFLRLLYRGNENLAEQIYLQNGVVYISRERASQPGQYDTAALTSSDVTVEKLDFYINPNTACTEVSCGGQQRVTVVARIRSVVNPVTIDLQTTYSVRLYDL